MLILNSRISIDYRTCSPIPLFFPEFSRATWKSPSVLMVPSSRKLPLQRASALYLLQPIPSSNFQISAHSRRPTNRQNYLRKKLTQQRRQLQQVNEVRHIDGADMHESSLGNSGEESTSLEKRSLNNESNFDSPSDNVETNYNSTNNYVEHLVEKESGTEVRRYQFGESIMWNKLESWVEQYKKDSEFWGIGNGPIFTIFQNSEGKIERVVVNENEIVKRSRVDPLLDSEETKDFTEVNYKISFAKDLAKEIEDGTNLIPKNSSVAKFLLSSGEELDSHQRPKVTKSSFTGVIQNLTWKPDSFSRMSKVGVGVLCTLFVVWAIKGLFGFGENKKEHTMLEKEMLRRKMKARAQKEKIVKGSVEVMQDPVEPKSVAFTKPQLDRKELWNEITKVKSLNCEVGVVESSHYQTKEFMEKIEEIRGMARHAREIEKREFTLGDGNGKDDQAASMESLSSDSGNQEKDLNNEFFVVNSDGVTGSTLSADPYNDIERDIDESLVEEKETTPGIEIPNAYESSRHEVISRNLAHDSSSLNNGILYSDGPGSQQVAHEKSLRKNFKIIKSVTEAREYLAIKRSRPEMSQEPQNHSALAKPSENLAGLTLHVNAEVDKSSPLSERLDSSYPSECCNKDNEAENLDMENYDYLKTSGPEICKSNQDSGGIMFDGSGGEETDKKESKEYDRANNNASVLSMPNSTSTEIDHGGLIEAESMSTPLDDDNSDDSEDDELIGLKVPGTCMTGDVKDRSTELTPLPNEERWIEKNFHEIEPILEKISAGFRDNYLSARENKNLDYKIELTPPSADGNESELEWMKDEKLRDIVFKVRDNELSGRDPFHLVTEEDKCSFFSGLEKKIEVENDKLKNLHEYFHSNIENLDYGADGISLYDPPEKFIPRWKVPPAERSPDFLNQFVEDRETAVAESIKNSLLTKKTGEGTAGHLANENTVVVSDVSDKSSKFQKDPKISSKTIIEGSDGSVRAGKRSGKEYWEHTKKWSQGFLESYNTETDPEVKSVMKDIGKDLDRWITEKEIKEAAELMDKIPEKGQKFVKEKLDKVRREMEMFGPQAVVSKYREYADEKEEDYLWWLDLPCILCIELYTVENGEQRVGFYSLEMAADLELDPKQYHVIAFEDARDCKNLCYIIQAQMEILGNGNAFVIARPPKDAFREAKATGFSVTVIRKGQLQLNVDQKLEEVEELIVEIGSKIYHDKIMKERGVDINTLMKGVFGVSKPAKRRRSKRKSKRRAKQ